MLDFDTAQARLAQAGSTPSRTEQVSLQDCAGRILASPVIATLNLPPADNSAMDGYALRFADVAGAGTRLPIQQHSYAGDMPLALEPGKAIRLFTGSLMPRGADTVIMQEDVTQDGDDMIINVMPEKGRHVRYQGEDVREGTEILSRGTRLGAAEIALLASQGLAAVNVYPRLRIGILTTGDELIEPGQPLRAGQIYNSNGPMLAAMIAGMGAQTVHTMHAADTSAALTAAFDTLLADCDLVLTVGGVSVGDKDLVKPTIEALGGELALWRVLMKPGRPVALAHARNVPIVCLPGNPVSAYVVFTVLVSPLIRAMQGRHTIMPEPGHGRLSSTRAFHDRREEFLRVQADYRADTLPALTPHTDQGSAIISSLSWAGGLARIPAGTPVNDGDIVQYYDLARWLS